MIVSPLEDKSTGTGLGLLTGYKSAASYKAACEFIPIARSWIRTLCMLTQGVGMSVLFVYNDSFIEMH